MYMHVVHYNVYCVHVCIVHTCILMCTVCDLSVCVCAAGLYVQGIYRKSPGASSKRAVKATLEDGIVTHKHTHTLFTPE